MSRSEANNETGKVQLERTNYATETPWEPLFGFSRAVQVGGMLFVCGTTAINRRGDVLGVGDPYLQTKAVIDNIRKALEAAGASLSDVVRTRMYVTDLSKMEHFARAHREAFEKIRPACTVVQVDRLIDPRFLVNIEVEACLGVVKVNHEIVGGY